MAADGTRGVEATGDAALTSLTIRGVMGIPAVAEEAGSDTWWWSLEALEVGDRHDPGDMTALPPTDRPRIEEFLEETRLLPPAIPAALLALAALSRSLKRCTRTNLR